MRGPGDNGAVARLAGRQYGVVTRAQLVALGVGESRVERWLAAGRLLRLHPGVYAVGHRAPRREAGWLAAVLACGPGAVLSHTSAAALWAIREREGVRPHVTLAGHRRPSRIATHRARLAATDITARDRIPVTSPARTLVDLAHTLPGRELERALRQAQFLGLTSTAALEDALARRPSAPLRLLLDGLAGTQSALEDAFLALCRRHRLPAPRTQQQIGRHRVDFLWPRERVIVETDGFAAHTTAHAFQADRTLANAAALEGYTLLRFTHADVTRRPGPTARQLRAALRRA